MLFVLGGGGQSLVAQTDGVWNNVGGGNYNSAGNWVDSTIADGAGATADFGSLDINSDVEVFVDSDRTLGHLVFGDTGLGSAGTWYVGSNATPLSKITLDAGANKPTVTVNELTPTSFDDTFMAAYLGGTNGFRKLGAGTLTLGGIADSLNFAGNDISGVVEINEGTLRLDPDFSYFDLFATDSETQTIDEFAIADGATFEVRSGGTNDVSVPAGATATLRAGFATTQVNNVIGEGTAENPSTLNVELANDDQELSAHEDWSGFQTLNVTGLDAEGPTNFRLRPNADGDGFFDDSFLDTEVNLENATLRVRTNSGGNTVDIGELNGTADAVLAGGINPGGVARYSIGALNTDSHFAGDITFGDESFPEEFGPGGLDLIKVGTGTLTLSGDLRYQPINTVEEAQAANPVRRGGVTRIMAGTLALEGESRLPAGLDDTGTATNLGVLLSTVNIQANAVLDVSAASGTYSTSELQQVIGSGTIVGNYDHDEGILAPGDDNVQDGEENSATRVQTAGTLTFDDDLSFNGGEIAYDMSLDPNSGNDLIQVNGETAVGGGGTINPTFLEGEVPSSGTYTVLNSAGGVTGSAGGWSVDWPGRGAAPSVTVAGNELQFTAVPITGVVDLDWRGTAGNAWDNESTQNFHNNDENTADVFVDADNVTFGDTFGPSNTAVSNFDVEVDDDVAPSSVTIDASNDYTISGSGSIAGFTTLTKRGSGTLTLTVANTSTGAASIEEGTVNIGGVANALGAGPLTMSGATLEIENEVTSGMTNSSLTVADGTSNTIYVNGAPTDLNTNPVGLPGLAGSGDLLVTSSSLGDEDGEGRIFDFGVANSAFTGHVTIGPDTDAGALAITARLPQDEGGGVPDGTVTLEANSTLSARGNDASTVQVGALHGEAGSVLNGFAGGGTPAEKTWEIGALGTSTTFAGDVTDGGNDDGVGVTNLTKVGAGTLALTGNNDYTGDTAVEGGTLEIEDAYLADEADVYLSDGATLDLGFDATDMINALYVDGVSQPVGTYGGLGSGADFILGDLLSGAGLLDVTTFVEPTLLVGDYNENGVVDAADYTVWRDNLGQSVELANRDPANDGAISQDDYASWKSNFGAVLGAGAGVLGGSAVVPEPASAVLAVLGLAGWCASSRRRGRRL